MSSGLILVVDDDKINRQLIKGVLKKEGFEFIEAENGSEGVDMALEHLPDVILLDAIMPVMDGYRATAKLRGLEKTRRIPILMITALSEKKDKIRALESGVDDFISKPIDGVELTARCKSFIKASKLNAEYILATKNPVTDLANNIALFHDLDEEDNVCLFIISLDDFDDIKELFTVKKSNKLEKVFADNLMNYVCDACKDDFKTRIRTYHINDGEFAVLIDKHGEITSRESAYAFAENTYKNIKDAILDIDGDQYDISATIGFTLTSKNAYENAKMALRQAQKKNSEVVMAEDIAEEVQARVLDNMNWVRRVHQAIDNDKIVPYFQPILNNHTGKIEKYESLARLIGEDDKVYSPFFFLDVAKRSKYYSGITYAVSRKSVECFRDRGEDFSINLSLVDLENSKIKNFLLDMLEENTGLANRVIFELTEDENIRNTVAVSKFVEAVRSFGAKIAIDDFGSGYSNFQRLLELEPDYLKIDGTLIKDIDQNVSKQQIVETMVSFAKRSGIKTVAEFVENETILKIITDFGIDYSQGYYIAKPAENPI